MITLTFAGDEAGDVSFAFDRGATRYFVVAVISTPTPDMLRQVLTTVRQESALPSHYEFRFHTLSSARLRRRVLTALSDAEFESWALIVDKTELSDTFKVMSRIDFYVYFVTELIRLVPTQKREGATLILDEFGSAALLKRELGRLLSVREIPRHFKRIVVRRSRSEPLIQIADLVAGSILRRDSKRDAEAYDFLANKINRVFEFHG